MALQQYFWVGKGRKPRDIVGYRRVYLPWTFFQTNGDNHILTSFAIFTYISPNNAVPENPECKYEKELRRCLNLIHRELTGILDQLKSRFPQFENMDITHLHKEIPSIGKRMACKDDFNEIYEVGVLLPKSIDPRNPKRMNPNIIFQSEHLLRFTLFKLNFAKTCGLVLISRLDICDYCIPMFQYTSCCLPRICH